MRLAARMLLALAGLALSAHALADQLPMTREKSERTVSFGDIRITQTFDSMKDPGEPEFKVRVHDKDRLLLELSDAAFGAFLPSPNGELFVGLSNGGWPGTAAIIFDRRGRILQLVRHNLAVFDYCAQTSTFLKEWYDEEDPQLRFPPFEPSSGLKGPGITLRDCHGKTVDLLDLLNRASKLGELALRNEVNMISGRRQGSAR